MFLQSILGLEVLFVKKKFKLFLFFTDIFVTLVFNVDTLWSWLAQILD